MSQDQFQDAIQLAIRRGTLPRRAALGALAALPFANTARAQSREVVMANWGGVGDAAQKRTYGAAFERLNPGARFGTDTSGPSIGRIRGMVESGRVTWDVAESNAAGAIELGARNLLAPVDYTIVDRAKAPLPGFALEHGVASYAFSSVIAWDSAKFPEGPRGWVDFWDLRRFPGTRMLRRAPHTVFEAAVMSTGVPADKVFPLDERVALARLREIRRNLVYWNNGSESENLLRTGEAVMGLIWHTRAKVLEEETRGRVKHTFVQGILQPGTYVVPRGAPGGVLAQRLLAAMQDPDAQLGLFEALGNSPVNPEAIARVPEAGRRYDPMAPANQSVQCIYDGAWWAQNQTRLTGEYLDLITG
ncbi:extracellular solute-binding protein [Roseomonas sp. CCTCC AB2023176]|uniref:extracellular solute-binding protein n=1 Tax=Roseomonas sp. CCTCC AB2023176 TaxID=3342640 RepID=UPI0035DA3F3B